MKKTFFKVLLCSLITVPFAGLKAQSTVVDGQSTEGKDFWVTFMQADQDPNNELSLSLSISSRENCQVTIANPFTRYSETVDVKANEMQLCFPIMLAQPWRALEKYVMPLIRRKWTPALSM